jgi:hypothetical protein
LMHPKKPFDVEVNPHHIATAERGIEWFNKTYIEMVDKCQTHLDQTVEATRKSKRGSTLA